MAKKKHYKVATGRTVRVDPKKDPAKAGDTVSLDEAEAEALIALGDLLPPKAETAAEAKARAEAEAEAAKREEDAAAAKAKAEADAKAKAEAEAAAAAAAKKSA